VIDPNFTDLKIYNRNERKNNFKFSGKFVASRRQYSERHSKKQVATRLLKTVCACELCLCLSYLFLDQTFSSGMVGGTKIQNLKSQIEE